MKKKHKKRMRRLEKRVAELEAVVAALRSQAPNIWYTPSQGPYEITCVSGGFLPTTTVMLEPS